MDSGDASSPVASPRGFFLTGFMLIPCTVPAAPHPGMSSEHAPHRHEHHSFALCRHTPGEIHTSGFINHGISGIGETNGFLRGFVDGLIVPMQSSK